MKYWKSIGKFIAAVLVVGIAIGAYLRYSALSFANEENGPVLIDSTTVIGFFPPVTESDLEKDSELNEVLSDFQWHLGNATVSMEKKHVRVVEMHVKEIAYKVDGRSAVFSPKNKVGYLMVAPGRNPKAMYGVMTDIDLGNAVDAYLTSK